MPFKKLTPTAPFKSKFVVPSISGSGATFQDPQAEAQVSAARSGASTSASNAADLATQRNSLKDFINQFVESGRPLSEITAEEMLKAPKATPALVKEVRNILGLDRADILAKVPADKAMLLADGTQMPKILSSLSEEIKKSSAMGPIVGKLRRMVPWDTEAQSLQAKVDTTKQLVGKFLEGGVLRKEDEEKYKKILSQITDTPEVAQNKLGELHGILTDRYNSYLDSLGSAKYDVSGFKRLDPNENIFGEQPETRPMGHPDPSKQKRMDEIKALLGAK
jgi:hypothetical protein